MIEFGHDKDSGYWLRAEMLVEQPLETVFDFFADAKPVSYTHLTLPTIYSV